MHKILTFAAFIGLGLSASVQAAEVRFDMHAIDAQGVGASLGFVFVRESPNGLVFTPDLKGLPVGPHGFHVHEKANCGPGEKDGKPAAGLAAAGHYDPKGSGKHLGPSGEGHAGDLPQLIVDADGTARQAITTSRLTLADLKDRALMIHAEPDNYADKPGGARIACGIIGM